MLLFVCAFDRVTKAPAWAAEGHMYSEDAASSRGPFNIGPDPGQASGQGHGPGGAHSREEGPVPQTRGVPDNQPGKAFSENHCMID